MFCGRCATKPESVLRILYDTGGSGYGICQDIESIMQGIDVRPAYFL